MMDTMILAVVGLSVVIMFSSSAVAVRRRLKRLERRVDLILNHLGLNPNQDVNPQIVELLKAGQKIGGIDSKWEMHLFGLVRTGEREGHVNGTGPIK